MMSRALTTGAALLITAAGAAGATTLSPGWHGSQPTSYGQDWSFGDHSGGYSDWTGGDNWSDKHWLSGEHGWSGGWSWETGYQGQDLWDHEKLGRTWDKISAILDDHHVDGIWDWIEKHKDGSPAEDDVATPSPVPVPASGLLLIAGVAGAGALRRRRKSA